MKHSSRVFLALAATAAVAFGSSEPLLARGGAANIMNSPGYQRRLQESRRQLSQPNVQAAPVRRHKKHGHP